MASHGAAREMQMTDSGCPACGSANVLSTGRNHSGDWKCVSCGHAFADFASAPETTRYAVKDDEPVGYATDPRDPIPQRPSDAWRAWGRDYSTPGTW